MWYINFKYKSQPTETIDEFTDYDEATRCLGEYRLSNQDGCRYWISTRATKAWMEKGD